jgi:hypothetical protein
LSVTRSSRPSNDSVKAPNVRVVVRDSQPLGRPISNRNDGPSFSHGLSVGSRGRARALGGGRAPRRPRALRSPWRHAPPRRRADLRVPAVLERAEQRLPAEHALGVHQRQPREHVVGGLRQARAGQVGELVEGVDLAVRVGPLEDSSLTARRLGTGRVLVVASPALLARHAPVPPGTLGDLPTVGLRPSETWSVNGRPVKVHPDLVVNDLEIACAVVVAGAGVGRLSTLVCGDAVDRGLLVPLSADGEDDPPIHLVYPTRVHLPARVRLLVDTLVDRVGGSGT